MPFGLGGNARASAATRIQIFIFYRGQGGVVRGAVEIAGDNHGVSGFFGCGTYFFNLAVDVARVQMNVYYSERRALDRKSVV